MTVQACVVDKQARFATMSRGLSSGGQRKKVEVERLAIVAPPVSYLTFIIIFGNDSVDVQRTNAEKAGTNNFTPEANFVPRADHLP